MIKLKQSGLAVLRMILAWVWHHKNGRLYIPAGPGLNAERCHRENSQKEMRAVSGSFAWVVRATWVLQTSRRAKYANTCQFVFICQVYTTKLCISVCLFVCLFRNWANIFNRRRRRKKERLKERKTISYLVLWAHSATRDYTRTKNKLHSVSQLFCTRHQTTNS